MSKNSGITGTRAASAAGKTLANLSATRAERSAAARESVMTTNLPVRETGESARQPISIGRVGSVDHSMRLAS